MDTTDRVIYQPVLRSLLGVSRETFRQYRRNGKIPEPDVKMSQKIVGWKL